MVWVHVKSATDKDEWLFSTPASTPTAALVSELMALHNMRVRLRGQMLAAWNLRYEDDGQHMQGLPEEAVAAVQAVYEEAKAVTALEHVAARKACTANEIRQVVEQAETTARTLFPACAAPDAVDALYKAREDPDTPEGDRLRAWYFLELIDPMFKERDFLPSNTKLWWAGKEIAQDEGKLLSDYCGQNEKSKMVCKLAAGEKGCPSREPRVNPEAQRELRRHFEHKRETFRTLEASELADVVRRPPRDHVVMSAGRATDISSGPLFGTGGGDGLISLNTNVRPIHNPSKVETELSFK